MLIAQQFGCILNHRGYLIKCTFNDTIQRVLTFPLPIERVWSAITDPAEVRQWVGDRSENDLRESGEGFLRWEDESFRMRIVVLEPLHRFTYRWATSHESDFSVPFEQVTQTLVEYVPKQVPDGTRLTLTESGFASHPEQERGENYADNVLGWDDELDELLEYLVGDQT